MSHNCFLPFTPASHAQPLRRGGFVAACLLTLAAFSPAQALDSVMENLTFENGEKGTAKFARVEITGTNLTQEEVTKLFASATPQAEREALFARLDADNITLQGISFTKKDGAITISNAQLAKIKAGKIAVAGLEGAEANFTDDTGGKNGLKIGKMAVDGADISSLFSGNAGNFALQRFAMQDMVLSVPDKDTPATALGGNTITLKLASLAMDSKFDGSIPLQASGSLKDFAIVPPPASMLAQQLAFAGYDKLVLGFEYSASYDPAARALALEDMTISGAGAGALKLKFRMGGVDKAIFTGSQEERASAMMQVSLGAIILHYADAGLVNKSFGLAAHEQKRKPEDVKAEATAMIRQFVPVMLGGAPNALQVADTLVKFVETPSSLGVTLLPKGGAVPIIELAQLGEPMAVLGRVALDVQSGAEVATLPPLPPPAPAPQSPAQAPKASSPQSWASAPSNAAPSATKSLTGFEAWAKLVGNTVVGKNPDGDPLYEYYLSNGSVKQWFDGKVTTGKWNLKGKNICFKFPDDDDETCYGLQVSDNIVIFIDESGTKTRYELFPGNAKKL
jgi:hypothetical protein